MNKILSNNVWKLAIVSVLVVFFGVCLVPSEAVYANNLTNSDLAASMIRPIDEYVPDMTPDEDTLSLEELGVENDADTSAEESEQVETELKLVVNGVVPDNASATDKYYANALLSRDRSLNGCMQNFAILKHGNDSIMLGSFAGGTNVTSVIACSRNSNGATAMEYGKINVSTQGSSGQTFLRYRGHGSSIELLEHNGHVYALYVRSVNQNMDTEANPGKAPHVLACRELIFGSDGAVQWSNTERAVSLFSTYDGKSQYDCHVAVSPDFVCLAVSYGTSITNDRERYFVYNRNAFMNAVLGGASSQSAAAIQSCRRATGMFPSGSSIGMIITPARTVLQSLSVGRKNDSNGNLSKIIVFAAVDDRGSNSTDGRKTHLITRAYLVPKAAGSDAAKSTQNMKTNGGYYSKLTHLKYVGASTTLEHALNSAPNGLGSERTELEGLKRVTSQGNGIGTAWYVSTHNSRFTNRTAQGAIPTYGNMPDYTSGAIPWNLFVCTAQTTPTTSWN
jgi:hypothetical protein